MLNKHKKLNEGFTIIEVMIVLAIAGLILLIVFLAVPALQRSQKNTARKSDAGHVQTAVNDFEANNNGVIPGDTGGGLGGTWAVDCVTLIGNSLGTGDAGTLAQYTNANGFGCGAYAADATGTQGQFVESDGAIANTTQVAGQAMILDVGATCPTANDATQVTTQVANTNDSLCLLYTIQSSHGNWDWDSIQM